MIKNLRWYIVGLLLFSTMLSYLDRQTLSIAAPVLRDKFAMSNWDYSVIVQSFLIAYGIMQPFAGRIIDWLNTRRGFCLAVIWWSIANMLHALAGSVASFSICRFLLGVGEAGNFPAAIKTVSEWFPSKERALATGIFNMGAGFGAIIAPPLVGVLIIHFGWQSAFLVTGAIGFVWAIAWLWLYHAPSVHPKLSPQESKYISQGQDQDPATGDKKIWHEIIGRKDLWACILARFISDPVWWFYIFWLPDYLKNSRGFGIAQIAMFAWLPFLTADFGSILGGYVNTLLINRGFKTLTARKISICIFASMMPVALLAVRAESAVVAIACICIATMGHQGWAASILTLPADLFPRYQVASAYGLTGAAGSFGGVLFAGIIGLLLDKVGYLPIFTMVGFMHPAAALLILLLIKNISKGPAVIK